MTPDQLQIVANVLTDVARTLAVIAIAQRLSEACSDEEKMFLSRALSDLISNFQAGQRLGRRSHQASHGDFGMDERMYQ